MNNLRQPAVILGRAEEAYRLVQAHAMRSWEEEGDFRASIEADGEVRKYLSLEKLSEAFDPNRQLQNIDRIFERVFGHIP